MFIAFIQLKQVRHEFAPLAIFIQRKHVCQTHFTHVRVEFSAFGRFWIKVNTHVRCMFLPKIFRHRQGSSTKAVRFFWTCWMNMLTGYVRHFHLTPGRKFTPNMVGQHVRLTGWFWIKVPDKFGEHVYPTCWKHLHSTCSKKPKWSFHTCSGKCWVACWNILNTCGWKCLPNMLKLVHRTVI